MQSNHIILGFSDIKSEFITKTRTVKQFNQIGLWFTYTDHTLYVHDYADHNANIVLASYDTQMKLWRVYLRNESYGAKVTRYLIANSPKGKFADTFNNSYQSHGYTRPKCL